MERISESLLTFLLNGTWQIAAISALAALAGVLLRKGPARYRHLIWAAAVLGSITVPTISALRHPVTTSLAQRIPTPVEPSVSAESPASTAADLSRPAGPSRRPTISLSASVSTILTAAYVLVLLCGAVRFGRAWRETRRVRASARAVDVPSPLAHVWPACLRKFSLRRVQLLSSADVSSPVALGTWHPVVIVPQHLWNEPSEELLTAVIGHELAHVARYDFLANVLYEMFFVAIAFHPAAWYIRRQLQRTREMACDEAVTTLLLQPQAYARSILEAASAMAQQASAGYSLGVFEGGALEDRIRRVLRRSSLKAGRARVYLAAGLCAVVMTAGIAAGLAVTARGQSTFDTHMRQGVAAYNTGDFQTASREFTSAISAAPADIGAKLYLANSLMSEFYAQGNQADARLRTAAMQQYSDVLARDPNNKPALAGITTLTMESKQLPEAREWALRLSAVDPNDKTALYTLGVIDWMIVYPEYQRARTAARGAPENYSIPDANLRTSFREQCQPKVDEGIKMLGNALTLDPNYDAAMAYINLLYRLKAAMADSEAESASLLADADKWVGKALEAKKRNETSAGTTSAKLDLNGPPPGPPTRVTLVRAPPPPPPPPSPDRAQQIASALPKPSADTNQVPNGAQYWQVVGSVDMPAIDLFRSLRAKGFEAMLHASPTDQQVRVLTGPYFDEAVAAKAKTQLEAEGFRVLRKWE